MFCALPLRHVRMDQQLIPAAVKRLAYDCQQRPPAAIPAAGDGERQSVAAERPQDPPAAHGAVRNQTYPLPIRRTWELALPQQKGDRLRRQELRRAAGIQEGDRLVAEGIRQAIAAVDHHGDTDPLPIQLDHRLALQIVRTAAPDTPGYQNGQRIADRRNRHQHRHADIIVDHGIAVEQPARP